MHRVVLSLLMVLAAAVVTLALAARVGAEPRAGTEQRARTATSLSDESPPAADGADAPGLTDARLRSQLLHETLHGALQVMHRDYFRDGSGRMPVPSDALEDVFAELEKSWGVKVKWLAVNARPMNPDHSPQTPFDKAAIRAIAGGADHFDQAAGETYRYAGRIVLGTQCLSCHVPRRTSNDDRSAAVVISMPLELIGPTTQPSATR